MKNMKTIIVLLLIILASVSMFSCSSSTPEQRAKRNELRHKTPNTSPSKTTAIVKLKHSKILLHDKALIPYTAGDTVYLSTNANRTTDPIWMIDITPNLRLYKEGQGASQEITYHIGIIESFVVRN